MENNSAIFSKVIEVNPRRTLKRGEKATFIDMKSVEPFTRKVIEMSSRKFNGSGSKFRKGDTIFARITPCLENGKTAFIDDLDKSEVAFGSTEFIVFSGKEGISDNRYIYYLCRTPKIRDYAIKNMVGTSGRQRVDKSCFDKLEICLPCLEEQQKIASVLSVFDDKIELNNEMNKTLEQMAQAIFKSWFVDFEPFKDGEFEESELGMIPKEWKVGSLGEIVEVNPKTVLTKGKKYSFVDMKNVPTNSVRIDAIINKEFSGGGSRFKNGDVIFARITPCLENGKTAIVDFLDENEVAFGSTEFLVFRGIDWNGMYYSYCLSRYNPFRVYAVQHMNGSSGRQRVSKGNIEAYKIVIPPEKLLLEFNKQVYCYFEKIKQNDVNSNSLKAIRDALLPKLISGEIKL